MTGYDIQETKRSENMARPNDVGPPMEVVLHNARRLGAYLGEEVATVGCDYRASRREWYVYVYFASGDDVTVHHVDLETAINDMGAELLNRMDTYKKVRARR